LFNRESYPLKLTEAGELYLEYVRDIIAKEKQLIRALADLHEGTRGLVRMGITPWRSSIIMPAVLPGFDSQYPNIKIEIYEGPHQDLASMLEHDKIDFSVFHLPHSYQNITFEHLFYEPILLAINKATTFWKILNLTLKKRLTQ
jgi:DNA-binding transcriptional LysR family regulator